MLRLVDVYSEPVAATVLYSLLQERTPDQAISHRRMPDWNEHLAFIQSKPYAHWYLLQVKDEYVGSAYLTRANEIGIFVFRRYVGKRYGWQGVRLLMAKHPGELLANVNPHNEPSIRMFEKLGFTHIQNTYELRKT